MTRVMYTLLKLFVLKTEYTLLLHLPIQANMPNDSVKLLKNSMIMLLQKEHFSIFSDCLDILT